jgi:ring-1,2-phenylacetyl-CoA epoxidase subunit PaaE
MSTTFHHLAVSKIQKETEDTVSISFAMPEDLKKEFTYTQGQYLTLKFEINGKEARRAYSMSSSPLENDLTVSVKRVAKGLVSNHIADNLKIGDKVEVMPPQGRFFTKLDVTNRKHYYMIAGGSGITPIMSIIKTIMEAEPQSIVSLLYSNRTEESIIFKNQLDGLQTLYANQLYVEYILSQPKREKTSGLFSAFKKGTLSWSGKVGRINRDVMNEWLLEHPAVHKQTEYFICGPEGMMQAAESLLLSKQVDKKNIHAEHFSTATTDKNDNLKGAKITVSLRGEEIVMQAVEGKTILDMLIDLKKDAPYSCTSGACSTCMAKVTKGTVMMDSCYALDDSEVKAGYILTCQAHPTSSEVEITYEN